MARSLLRSTGVVSAMTLVSRVLGFVRDVLLASLFGAGAAMDVFFVAFRIPNLFRRLFAEGAFAQSFVPVFSEARARRTPEDVQRLVGQVSGTLAGALAVLTTAGVLGAPLIFGLFAPGFLDQPEKYAQGVALLRWTFPYLLFISLTALFAGILNAHGRFALPAFNPVWLNVCMIGAAWWYAPGVEALAIAVFVAGMVQLLFLLPSVAGVGMLARPRWGGADPDVRRILKLMVPIMIGSSVSQLSLLLDTVIASFLPGDGNVAWLWYADRLMEFPLGVFSIAIATVILPSLSRQHADESAEAFSRTLDWGLRMVLVVGIPAAIGLFLLAGPLVSTLFQRNAFTPDDVTMTAWALMAYAVGFLGFSVVKVLIPGFYARQETRIPLRYAAQSLGLAMVLSLTLTGLALWSGFVAPHAAIATATATGAWVNAGLLLRRLHGDTTWRPAPGWGRFGGQLAAASAVLAAFLLGFTSPIDEWTVAGTGERAWWLAGLVGGGAAAWFATLLALGLRPSAFRLESP